MARIVRIALPPHAHTVFPPALENIHPLLVLWEIDLDLDLLAVRDASSRPASVRRPFTRSSRTSCNDTGGGFGEQGRAVPAVLRRPGAASIRAVSSRHSPRARPTLPEQRSDFRERTNAAVTTPA